MSTLTLDRREFLKTGTVAGAALLIGFHLPASAAQDPARGTGKENSQSVQCLGAHHARQSRHADSRQVGDGPGHHDRSAHDSRGRALRRLEEVDRAAGADESGRFTITAPAAAAALPVLAAHAPGRRRSARNAGHGRGGALERQSRYLQGAKMAACCTARARIF